MKNRLIKFRVFDGEQMHYALTKPGLAGSPNFSLLPDKPTGELRPWPMCELAGTVRGLSFVNDAILMQYTGLQDADGVDIYEGDMIGFKDDDPLVVRWDEGHSGFRAVDPQNPNISLMLSLQVSGRGKGRVVGNIYEHEPAASTCNSEAR